LSVENRTAAPRHDGTSVWSEVLWSSRDLEWVDLGDMRDIVRERGNIPGSEMVLLVGRMGEGSIVEAYVDIWIWVVKGVLRAEVVCSVSVSVDSRHHGVVGGHEGVVGVVAESGHRGDSQRRPVPILVVVVFSERFMRGLPRLSQVKPKVAVPVCPCHHPPRSPRSLSFFSLATSSLPFSFPIPIAIVST